MSNVKRVYFADGTPFSTVLDTDGKKIVGICLIRSNSAVPLTFTFNSWTDGVNGTPGSSSSGVSAFVDPIGAPIAVVIPVGNNGIFPVVVDPFSKLFIMVAGFATPFFGVLDVVVES